MDSIIFDLDGTLWDARKTVSKAWTEVVQKELDENRIVTEEDLRKTMGMRLYDTAAHIFSDIDEEKRRMELIKKCSVREQIRLAKEGGKLYEGLEDALVKLSAKYRLFIVSNCQEGYIEAFYEYHGLGHFFEDDENPGRTGLSKGKNIKLVMERNSLKSPVYVGDTEIDRKAASFAGIPFVFAAYGFGQVKEYDYRIERISELIEYL